MTRHVGDYLLVEPMGPGAHGMLWTACPPRRLGRTGDVGLKLFDVLDDTVFERAVRELRLLAKINSHHVMQPIEAGSDRSHLFYSFELPSGGTLADSSGSIPASAVIQAVADAARGVHALHEGGLAHRNISPSTVWLGEVGLAGDIGLAGGLDAERSTTGPIGSAAFTDPAVLKGGRATRATDIFSLGMTLRWSLTREHWLPSDRSEVSLLRHAVRASTPRIDEDTLDTEVMRVVRACTEIEPTARPGTAAELADLCDALVLRARTSSL